MSVGAFNFDVLRDSLAASFHSINQAVVRQDKKVGSYVNFGPSLGKIITLRGGAVPSSSGHHWNAAEPSLSVSGQDNSEISSVVEDGDQTKVSRRTREVVVQRRIRGGMVKTLLSRIFAMEGHELPKFLSMSFMMFAIIYVFTMTRCVMDVCMLCVHVYCVLTFLVL